MRQQSTSLLLSVARRAMCPALRPISFTTPTPFGVLCASTCPALIAACAFSTAVSNPKDLRPTSHSLVRSCEPIP
ncbi:hypothetical protein Mapa_009272 [Marchantia paleacea]|nr:hypothetical protein Mapa_009272 [Marchantia paleacea]